MRKFLFLFLLIAAGNVYVHAQSIPTPKEHFGFNIGDNYKLATYTQTEAYFKKLAAASDRIKLEDIGMTEEGRHQYMLVVSSPENLKNLARYKEISQKLAHADITETEARALSAEGKPVVWIDGGLHATEVVGAHQLIETIYQFASRKDPETIKILDQAIILFTHCNPDGQELVSSWYMRNPDTLKRRTDIPRLYQKYIGHDNNRDFYMMNMKETQNMSRQQYVEWMPQIIYNHHQTGPPGSVLAGPPYRDPFNYVFDPLIVTSIDAVGAAMNNRLNRENKPGYTQRSGSSYSTWWNGGLRTTPYFHNIIGLLTEIIGGPTPSSIPVTPQRLIPNMATPNPVLPQKWYFRQSIDYSVSLNYAVLNYAVNQKEDLLYGIYRMGRNSIEAGLKDHWSLSPKKADSIAAVARKEQRPALARPGAPAVEAPAGGEGVRLGGSDTASMKFYDAVMKDKTLRDSRAYVLPADQPDFATATRFINALIWSGIQIHKATAAFSIEGKNYPAGSYVVKTSQAFRPHVMDMFEPQDHPNDFLYPGGPPIRPYDAAGWTLAYTMGVKFDRILENYEAPLVAIPYGEIQQFKAKAPTGSGSAGYLISAKQNNAYIAVNDLLKAGSEVYRLTGGGWTSAAPNTTMSKSSDVNNSNMPPGTFYVPSPGKGMIEKFASTYGVESSPVSKRPGALVKLNPSRIAIWDNYGGSMPAGWIKWIMEQYHYDATVIYSKDVDAGNLRSKFDAIVFVSGAIPAVGRAPGGFGGGGGGGAPRVADVPEEFRPWMGRLTADTSIPQIRKFIEAGGSVIAIGSSTSLAYHLGLPVKNALTEMSTAGVERPLPGEKYYIPGSVLRVSLDSLQTATWGMQSICDVYFDASPVFNITPSGVSSGQIVPLAWFSGPRPLRSGWAYGQEYLQDGVAAFEASIGSGKLFAFGPEITFRAQTHGTFKLFFNQLYGYGQTKK